MFSSVCLILDVVVWWFGFGGFGGFGVCYGFIVLGWLGSWSFLGSGLGGFVSFALWFLVGCFGFVGLSWYTLLAIFWGVYLRLDGLGRWFALVL